MGLSPYIQVKGLVEEGVQLVPLALGGPSHHLGELVPGLQGELHEGVAGAWWDADISPLPRPLCPGMNPTGGLGHTVEAAGGLRAASPQPPAQPGLLEGAGASPSLPSQRPAGLAAGAVTSPGELPERQPDPEKVPAHPGVFFYLRLLCMMKKSHLPWLLACANSGGTWALCPAWSCLPHPTEPPRTSVITLLFPQIHLFG